MSAHNVYIPDSGDPNPNPLDCQHCDTVTWTNNASTAVDSFHLPSCVTPQDSLAPIAAGATTRVYTVRHDAEKKRYSYTYGFDGEPDEVDEDEVDVDTQNGTIDVS